MNNTKLVVYGVYFLAWIAITFADPLYDSLPHWQSWLVVGSFLVTTNLLAAAIIPYFRSDPALFIAGLACLTGSMLSALTRFSVMAQIITVGVVIGLGLVVAFHLVAQLVLDDRWPFSIGTNVAVWRDAFIVTVPISALTLLLGVVVDRLSLS